LTNPTAVVYNGSMKTKIILSILFDLLQKRKITAEEAAQKYGLSPRTIYRYVDELILADVPVTVKTGRNGGFFLSDSYKLPMRFFTDEEFVATAAALEKAYLETGERALKRTLDKLNDQNKTDTRDMALTANFKNLLVDSGVWADFGFHEKIRIFETCVLDSMVVDIEYEAKTGAITRRKIEPHLLYYRQNVWQVYAFCRMIRAFRLFKLGRIRKMNVTEMKFIRRRFSRDDVPLTYPLSDCSLPVELQFSEEALHRAQDWLGVENIHRIEGKNLASVTLPDDEILLSKILSFGTGVRVIAPEELRQKVKKFLTDLTALYDNPNLPPYGDGR